MTETLVLIFDDPSLELVDLAQRLSILGEIHQERGVLTVRRGDDRCYVVKVIDPEEDGVFEDWPEALLPGEPSAVFSANYRSPLLAVDIAHLLAGWRALKVDTNYGQVVAGGEIDLRILRRPY